MSLLKAIGPPGSLGFLVVATVGALFIGYVWPRRPRLANLWLLAVLGGYLLLSWPPTAGAILASLPAPAQTAPETLPASLDTLVVLDGDNRRGRVRMAEQVIEAAAPRVVYVAGSPLILKAMSADLLARVSRHPAANTREQMTWVQGVVAEGPAGRTAVLVSRIQAPRASLLAARAGIDVRILASALDVEPPQGGAGYLIPTYAALCASRDALYERVALYYYRWREWT